MTRETEGEREDEGEGVRTRGGEGVREEDEGVRKEEDEGVTEYKGGQRRMRKDVENEGGRGWMKEDERGGRNEVRGRRVKGRPGRQKRANVPPSHQPPDAGDLPRARSPGQLKKILSFFRTKFEEEGERKDEGEGGQR
jgi:hypothetical protein